METIRNECNRGTKHDKLFADKSWRDQTMIGRRMLRLDLNEDMKLVDVSKAVSFGSIYFCYETEVVLG